MNEMFDLKAFRKANKISQQELAEYLNIGQGFVSQMERGDRPIPKPILEKIMDNPEWSVVIDTLENRGEIIVNGTGDRDGMIPLLPYDAIAGPGTFNFQDEQIEDYYKISDFTNSDFLLRVKGDSMTPKYTGGDIIACRVVKDMLFFQWGRVYALCTKSQGLMIKRLMPSENEGTITCVSYNEEYPPFEIPKEDIVEIALVNGSISLE